MFGTKTLFVVGAGASNEANLPTGDGLKSDIAKRLNILFKDGYQQSSGDYAITDALREYVRQIGGSDINPYLHSAWQIRDALSQALSIDNFIDAHKHDAKIELCGKLAIAQAILEAEKTSKMSLPATGRGLPTFPELGLTRLNGTWYQNFSRLLFENVRKDEVENIFGNVAFIIFNYDRCIEQYLYYALKNYYLISDQEARAIMGTLTVLHPYGHVGRLPWQDEAAGVSFGGTNRRINLLTIASQIQTFTERKTEKLFLSTIRQTFSEAHTIVFLGFAFHELNMELLAPENAEQTRRIYATAKGLSDSDVKIVNEDILKMFSDPPSQLNVRNDLTCESLFTEFWRSLSRV